MKKCYFHFFANVSCIYDAMVVMCFSLNPPRVALSRGPIVCACCHIVANGVNGLVDEDKMNSTQ